jgi:hypothetical protein
MPRAVIGVTLGSMSDKPNVPVTATVRRVQVVRRPRRREVYTDMTLTTSWPPRLNKSL